MYVIKVEDPETGKWKQVELLCESKEAKQTVGWLRQAGFQVTEPKLIVTK